MEPIATYVFMDLETTGLPIYELNKTRITELSMVAVSREHILETIPQQSPRVKHKLTLCFNPGRLITPDSTKITGLCNFLLDSSTYFNENAFEAINSFLSVLQKPVCLIAYNGNKFDFPILKNHLERIECKLSNDIMCADNYIGFCDILKKREEQSDVSPPKMHKEANSSTHLVIKNDSEKKENNLVEINSDCNKDNKDRLQMTEQLNMKLLNESTPKSSTVKTIDKQVIHARKRLHFDSRSQQSYKLERVYERLLQCKPNNAHQAESDCLMMIDIAVVLKKDFVSWVDENCCPFLDIRPMMLATPLGK